MVLLAYYNHISSRYKLEKLSSKPDVIFGNKELRRKFNTEEKIIIYLWKLKYGTLETSYFLNSLNVNKSYCTLNIQILILQINNVVSKKLRDINIIWIMVFLWNCPQYYTAWPRKPQSEFLPLCKHKISYINLIVSKGHLSVCNLWLAWFWIFKLQSKRATIQYFTACLGFLVNYFFFLSHWTYTKLEHKSVPVCCFSLHM